MNSVRRLLALLDASADVVLRSSLPLWIVGSVALIVVGATPLLMDLIVINKFPVDFIYPLDTALRWHHGHVPHRDYHTPVGLAYWLNQGLAIELFGYSAKSLFWSNIIASFLVGGVGYVVLRYRLSAGLAPLFFIGVITLILSPRLFGHPGGSLAYLAPYNKIGLAILAILVCAFFTISKAPTRRLAGGVDGPCLAFLLVWLCYLKLNFAVFAVAGGLVALVLVPANRQTISVALVTGLAAAALIGAITKLGHLYLQDVQATIAASEGFRWWKLRDDLAQNSFTWGLSLVAIGVYFLTGRAAKVARVETAVVAGGLLLASIFVMNQAYGSDFPLAFVALLVLAQRALGDPPTDKINQLSAQAPAVLIGAVLVAIPVIRDLQSMSVYVDDQRTGRLIPFCESHTAPVCVVSFNFFSTHALAFLKPLPDPRVNSASENMGTADPVATATIPISEHLQRCNDDRICVYWSLYYELYSLLNTVVTRHDRPLMLGFMNMLPFYYQLEPPKGVLAWFDVGRTLSAESRPSGDQILSDVTLLVVPLSPLIPDYKGELQTFYQADIDRMFHTVAETEAWLIMRKNPAKK